MTVNKIGLALAWVALIWTVAVPLPRHAFAQEASSAQSSGVLMDRIDRLERDIRTLNQQIARNPGASASPAPSAPASGGASGGQRPPVQFADGDGALSRVMVRLDALESEVRAATGQSESLSFRIDQLAQNLDKLMVDLDYRLARLEGGSPTSAPTPSAAPPTVGVTKEGAMAPIENQAAVGDGTVSKDGTFVPANKDGNVLGTLSKSKLDAIVAKDDQAAPKVVTAASSPATSSTLPEGSVQDQYRFAFDLTRQARYDEAEVAFKAFLDAHGKDDLADNARYWLAETYYVRSRFKEAAQAFFESYQKAPKGPKGADSLLKLGMSMAGLEKTSEACATFGKLRKEFSPLKPELEQALGREVKRLECK